VEQMTALLQKAVAVLPVRNLRVNPDCGLKTRGWEETKAALILNRQAKSTFPPSSQSAAER
jgi:methionine synthase II (cobalamin-independent)